MRQLLWSLVKTVLFKLDAEFAHRITVRAIRSLNSSWIRVITGAPNPQDTRGEVTVLGMTFSSRLGLAAGFDKDAELLNALPSLGFGFAEIGTVTPRPQPGNERPRLFRSAATRTVFNRMGFNGAGCELVAARIAAARPLLPPHFRVGINVGKNKDTPLDAAAGDYSLAVAAFEGLVDYVTINVSSPNTPGLRSLQTVEALRPIVQGVLQKTSSWNRKTPVLLKLAPEVRGSDLESIVREAESWGIDGWVLTNTLAGEWNSDRAGRLSGGLSGAPLIEESRRSLAEVRRLTRLPIISVGGILSAEEAELRLKAGADLIQVYSGWIFGGPSFPAEIRAKIDKK